MDSTHMAGAGTNATHSAAGYASDSANAASAVADEDQGAGASAQAMCNRDDDIDKEDGESQPGPQMRGSTDAELAEEFEIGVNSDPGPLRRCVAVLGARAVGKTALTLRLVRQQFRSEYAPTIEDTYNVAMDVDGIKHFLTILDTAGQDEFSPLSASYTVGVDGYILMFDVNRRDSFFTIKRIEQKLMHTLCANESAGTEEIPRILVGNQVDVDGTSYDREVTMEEAGAWAEELDIPYMECSALTGQNVTEVFREVLKISRRNQYWESMDYLDSLEQRENEAGPSRAVPAIPGRGAGAPASSTPNHGSEANDSEPKVRCSIQ